MPPQNISDSIAFDSTASPARSVAMRNIVTIAVLLAILGYAEYSSSASAVSFLGIFAITVIVVLIVSFGIFFKKVDKVFSADSSGITVNGKAFAWDQIKKFHMLGDSQSERAGLLGVRHVGVDLVNEYAGTSVFVIYAKTSIFSHKTLRLQVTPERTQEFLQLLASRGIQRESKIKMLLFGTSGSFLVIFIPFLLLVIVLLFYSLANK